MVNPNLRFLDAPGEVAAAMRERDWSATPLGAPKQWPQSLRSTVSLMLGSRFPMFVAWGPALTFLYNDCYAEILGGKHPAALGRGFKAVWPEIWDDIGPLTERALAGEAVYLEDLPLTVRRGGGEESAWFTFSYSPVIDEHGDVAGMYCVVKETTATVLGERARSAEMERMTALFEQAPGFLAVLRGRSHVYQIANPAYLDFVGRDDIVGRSVRDALPELDQKFIDLLTEVFDTGTPYIGRRIPVGLARGDIGQVEQRIVDFVFQPITDHSGRVDGILIQGTDITDQAVAEREVQTERRRLDAVIESFPTGVAFADPNGTITRVNAANRQMWGAHPMSEAVEGYGEWLGWWADGSARHGQRLKGEDWALARALRGEIVRGDIVEIQPFGDPQRRTLLLQATPVRLDDGELAGAVVSQTDITDRVRIEAELRASEARFRTIANAMPQMVWSTLPDGHHDYYNQQWYDYTGLPAGSTDGERWALVFHPDDQPRAWERWRQSLATGADYEIHYRLLHHTGQYRWVLGRAVAVRDDEGAIIRWMGTCTDVHEERLARDALERSERALRESDRRKDEFLAMLAHELRNPLAPISTAAHLLALTSDPARVQAAGDVIRRQVRQITELVDDLLDVSRVTRGLVQLETETVDLVGVLGHSIEQVRPLIDARRHQLDVTLVDEPLWVDGDRTRLTQVVSNLLNNAAKYTPEGGRLELVAERLPGHVAVHVRDNGQGISADLLPHVFDLFTQASRSPDRAQGGLGIGLALVRSLVGLHGGTIAAHSDGPGQGATFVLTLPSTVGASAPPPADLGPTLQAAGMPMDILIVDDNVDAAGTIQTLLDASGHVTRVFHRAGDALASAAARPFDVALLDIGLPDMTGHELGRRIRDTLGEHTGVLAALSGYGQPQDLDASRAAGLDFHLVKPVDQHRLAEVLDFAAQRKAQRRA